MKKYISYILLILILFASNSYWLYFKYLQYNIHQEINREINNGLDNSDLLLIKISLKNKTEIHWLKKDKEFIYKELMYDVVGIKRKNNEIYYYCINDIKEKHLIVNYIKHSRKRNSILLKLKKILNNKYFSENLVVHFNSIQTDFFFTAYQKKYNSIYLETLFPPPKA